MLLGQSAFHGVQLQQQQNTLRCARTSLDVVALRPLQGKCVSIAMSKTAVVQVDRFVPHPIYGKRVRKSKKFLALDEQQICNVGDSVEIVSIPPVSKKKCFKVKRIVKKSDL